mmetsp:Transcript_88556/g.236675  ORF Transcript_88556/g.236675 Transcript_88556/m.236675 type:complete len:209 (+) Transcript_88556:560-1186(+)
MNQPPTSCSQTAGCWQVRWYSPSRATSTGHPGAFRTSKTVGPAAFPVPLQRLHRTAKNPNPRGPRSPRAPVVAQLPQGRKTMRASPSASLLERILLVRLGSPPAAAASTVPLRATAACSSTCSCAICMATSSSNSACSCRATWESVRWASPVAAGSAPCAGGADPWGSANRESAESTGGAGGAVSAACGSSGPAPPDTSGSAPCSARD